MEFIGRGLKTSGKNLLSLSRFGGGIPSGIWPEGRWRNGKGADMSVLVTGGAGYIGGHMTLGLLDAGESVVVLDNLSTGFDWAAPDEARLVVGDVGDADLVARLIEEHEVDAIAHFAAKLPRLFRRREDNMRHGTASTPFRPALASC